MFKRTTLFVLLFSVLLLNSVAIADEEVKFCTTWEDYVRNQLETYGILYHDCDNGDCDDPQVRDTWIPGPEDPFLTIRLYFQIFCDDSGNDCATTETILAQQVADLNDVYSQMRIQFVYDYRFVNDSQYRHNPNATNMKNEYAVDPDEQCNVYVTDYGGGSFGTFPWDDVRLPLSNQGGVVLTESHVHPTPYHDNVLAHELGHNLGLWHTHHGVSEVPQCGECWEYADGRDADITGDLCSDTRPTPINYSCGDPGGTDPCCGVAWGETPYHNYMGYSTLNGSPCWTEFTPHQWGRIRCWSNEILSSWMIPEGYGYIRGRVTDFETGAGLDAELTVTNRNPQISAQTEESGWYTLLVPPDTLWEVTCEVPNSQYFPQVDSIMAIADDTVYLNFQMKLPAATISMIPYNPPIYIHPGESFTYAGILESNSSTAQTTDVWLTLKLPGGSSYGPISQYNDVPLDPYQQIVIWNISQYVPTFAPLGTYDYIASCGNYPSEVYDTAMFHFTVYGSALGTNNDWHLAGWFDDTRGGELPSQASLYSNIPNPFNAQTQIKFDIPEESDINLTVYNIAGRKIADLVDGSLPAGTHSVSWDASTYSSGIYFYKLTVGNRVFTKRMTLLK